MEEQLLDHGLSQSIEGIRPNSTRAKHVITALAVLLLLTLLSGYSSYLQIQLLEDFNAGIDVSDERIESNDQREVILSLLALVANVITIIMFLRWFRRAYFNKGIRSESEYTDGWAVGAWFVPILNLFRPYQIMKEMWRYTESKVIGLGASAAHNSMIVGLWWFLWIISSILGNVSFRVARNAETVDQLITSSQITLVDSLLSVPLTIAVIIMIKNYNEMTSNLLEAGK